MKRQAGPKSALLAASIPFWVAGFGVLELPIRWAEDPPVAPTKVGIVLATYGFAYGLMQIPGGFLTHKLGSVRTLQVALIIVAASWPLTLTHAWWLIAGGRAVYGGASALTFSAGLLLLRERLGSHRLPGATALFASFWAIGMALAAVIGWSEAIVAAVLAAAVASGLLFLGSQPRRKAVITLSLADQGRLALSTLAAPGVRILLVALPGAVFSQQAVITWGPRVGGGDPANIVIVGVLIAAGIAFGTWIGRILSAFFRGALIVAISPVITGFFLIGFVLTQELVVVRMAAIAGVTIASVLSWTPGLVRVLSETSSDLQPFATAVVNQAAWFFSSFAPLLLGLSATAASGLPADEAWIAIALVSTGAGVVTFMMDRAQRRRLGAAVPTALGMSPQSAGDWSRNPPSQHSPPDTDRSS